MHLAVIGIGQHLRGDDAAGLEAVVLWQCEHAETASRSDFRVQLVEQPGTELLDALEGLTAAVIVDATCSEAAPGTVRFLEDSDLEATELGAGGAHGWGVAEMLRMHRLLGAESGGVRVSILGIEARDVEFGASLSPEVRHALPQASAAIQKRVLAHLAE
jgi:hydrogenase maturation protease